jgi:hypothetical protein
MPILITTAIARGDPPPPMSRTSSLRSRAVGEAVAPGAAYAATDSAAPVCDRRKTQFGQRPRAR